VAESGAGQMLCARDRPMSCLSTYNAALVASARTILPSATRVLVVCRSQQ
jgi:hypothetical protein